MLVSAVTCITLLCFEFFSPQSAGNMSEEKRKKQAGQ
jgi:hypothetical protein